MQIGQYPDAHYRVSVKAIIKNKNGHVLVLHEGNDWTLPGGGIDHGEGPLEALERELYEEAQITAGFTAEFLGTDSFYVKSRDHMGFHLFFALTMESSDFFYAIGDSVNEISFRNPEDFKDSDSEFEQFIYKYGLLRQANTEA